jgi:hypothetical protein
VVVELALAIVLVVGRALLARTLRGLATACPDSTPAGS